MYLLGISLIARIIVEIATVVSWLAHDLEPEIQSQRFQLFHLCVDGRFPKHDDN